ncbi:hypothetical protein [Variovorax sp.]|jgi:hypothetical protein|uniref:hypothetical protein n=1 Tax=Variovorax sp. TaxID=1871043 RepID=UPI0037DA3445
MRLPSLLRNPRSATAFATALLLAQPIATRAQVERLEDSASPRSRVQAQLDTGFDSTTPGGQFAGSPFAAVHFNGVEYRLATARYAGRRARIFYFTMTPARYCAGLRQGLIQQVYQ